MSIHAAMQGAALGLAHRQKLDCYRHDIALWARERLGIHLWSKQIEIANSLIANKKTAVKSCHASGKSFTASVVIAWWVDTRIELDAIVVSTAPTYEQVNKILWEYLRTLSAKYDLPGKITMDDEWKDVGGRIVGFGRKPSDTNQHGFQGIHRRQGVLAVLDEACGIAESLWTGVATITTGKNDRILAIANPDDPASELGKIFADDDNGWSKITISAFDTPNFTGEYLPEDAKDGLISPEWVEEKKREWGEDSARYMSKVLGEFPGQGINTLFSQKTLANAINTTLRPDPESKPKLGCDIARFGADYTVLYSWHDGVLRLVDKWGKKDTVETAERIVEWAIKLGVDEVRIDGVGIGAGVYDQVTRLAISRWETIGLVGNAASPDLDKWANYRAYAYDTLREKMATGHIDMEYGDKSLKEELEGIQYKFSPRGAVQIESKDDMIRRGVKSPDFADAAMYACADLPVDPKDPVSKLKIGETFEIGMEQFLAEQEMSISMY
jgi:hypothetical protein